MFHLVPYVNIVLNILLCSPFSTCNDNIYCTIQAHLYFYITSYNVPFSDIFVLKHIFKACNYTIYCLIKSTLYFQKNVLYCPIITFIFLQNVINSPIFVQYCPKKHILKACNNTIYCLIQSTLYFQKNIIYCPIITPYIVRFSQHDIVRFRTVLSQKSPHKHVIMPC